MRKLFSVFMAFTLILGFAAPVHATPRPSGDWESAMTGALDWIRGAVVPNPIVDPVGGEWAVLALARAGRVSADDPWIRAWLSHLDRLLLEVDAQTARGHDINHPPSTGTFPSALRRQTDFHRVTLALSALGLDASDYRGRDLTAVYGVFEAPAQRHALNQTINVDTYALIALNAGPYSGDKDQYIQALVDAQRADGTWSLNPAAPASALDFDVTAMALQSLAPYYNNGDTRVTNAVDRALRWLSGRTA